MSIAVTLIGVGEAYDPAEPTSSALVEAAGFTLLIDCGHAAIQPLWRRVTDREQVDAIYVTHGHADHIMGLVLLMDRWVSEGRRKGIVFFSSAPNLALLQQLFSVMHLPTGPKSPFPVEFRDIAENAAIGPFAIAAAPTQHGGANHAIKLERAGRRLAYSGDGRPTDQSRQLYADADVLFHECYAPTEAQGTHGHADLPMIRSIAGPPRIGLYHIRAGYRDTMRTAVAGDARLFVPEAGDTFIL